MTSSGEGGPIRLARDDDMAWESLQAASGHFGIHAADLRRVRDVEIKINQGAKPGKGGRLSGAKVTPHGEQGAQHPGRHRRAVARSQARHLLDRGHAGRGVAVAALPQPLRHQDHRLQLHRATSPPACGRTSSSTTCWWTPGSAARATTTPTRSHVGWPDIFRTILHTHHALVDEKVDLDGSRRAAADPRPERRAVRRAAAARGCSPRAGCAASWTC